MARPHRRDLVQTFPPATKAKLKQAVLDREGTPVDSEAGSEADSVTSMLMKIHSAPGLHVPAKGDKLLIIHSDEVGIRACCRACVPGLLSAGACASHLTEPCAAGVRHR